MEHFFLIFNKKYFSIIDLISLLPWQKNSGQNKIAAVFRQRHFFYNNFSDSVPLAWVDEASVVCGEGKAFVFFSFFLFLFFVFLGFLGRHGLPQRQSERTPS